MSLSTKEQAAKRFFLAVIYLFEVIDGHLTAERRQFSSPDLLVLCFFAHQDVVAQASWRFISGCRGRSQGISRAFKLPIADIFAIYIHLYIRRSIKDAAGLRPRPGWLS